MRYYIYRDNNARKDLEMRLIIVILALLSLGGCMSLDGYGPRPAYGQGYYDSAGIYCPPGYYCDGGGGRHLIQSRGYGYTPQPVYRAPALSYQRPSRQGTYNGSNARQQMSCPAGYVNDGAGCALSPRGGQNSRNDRRDDAQSGWNTYNRDRRSDNQRDYGRPANQDYTPYDYGSRRQTNHPPEQRTIERSQARNDSSERRTVERRQPRNPDRRERRRSRN